MTLIKKVTDTSVFVNKIDYNAKTTEQKAKNIVLLE